MGLQLKHLQRSESFSLNPSLADSGFPSRKYFKYLRFPQPCRCESSTTPSIILRDEGGCATI